VTEPLLSPELFDRVMSSKKGTTWFAALRERARASGIEDPEAAAKGEMRSKLTGLLDRFAAKYRDVKLGALDQIVRLQDQASTFIDEALTSKTAPDVERFQDVLRNMDAAFDDLEKGIEQVKPESAGEAGAPAREPQGETQPQGPTEKLRTRDKLTKEQASYFKSAKDRLKAAIKAQTDPAERARLADELEHVRFEAKQTARRNQNQPEYPSFEKYEAVVAARRTLEVGPVGRGTSDAVRPAITDYVGKRLVSGDSFPTGEISPRTGKPKTTRLDVPVSGAGPSGETITTRPDSITVKPDGTPDPGGVVHDHKTWMGGDDGVIRDDKGQLAAQRKYAGAHQGRHVVSISSDVPPDLDAASPKPRPEQSVAEGSEVVFVDSKTNKVIRVWSEKHQKWEVPRAR
jgi:hypothetical protein